MTEYNSKAYRQGELIQGLFSVLKENPEGLQAQKALEELSRRLPPNDFEQEPYSNGERRYEKYIRFTTIGPVKAGWMEKHKGIWRITEEGKQALIDYPDPEKLMNRAGHLYKIWDKQRSHNTHSVDEDGLDQIDQGKAEETQVLIEEAKENAWFQISQHLKNIHPYDFQELVAGLLSAMNYHVQWIAPPGPDKGIDIIASSDPLGIDGTRLLVQVKRQQATLSVSEVRSFIAVLGENDVGLFVCTGGFTKDALQEARHQGKRRITLLDSYDLYEKWVDFYYQIPEQKRKYMPLEPVWYLSE